MVKKQHLHQLTVTVKENKKMAKEEHIHYSTPWTCEKKPARTHSTK